MDAPDHFMDAPNYFKVAADHFKPAADHFKPAAEHSVDAEVVVEGVGACFAIDSAPFKII